LDLGFHYAYNEDNWDRPTTRIPLPRRTFFRDGGFGLTNSNGLQMHQFGVDAAFKYQGFSAIGEYMLRVLDVRDTEHWPYAPLWQLTGDDSTNAQHGGYVQCGYMLPIPGFEDKLEVVARVGGISALSGGQEGTWEYAGGLNYYIQGNKVKLQTDVTKVSEVPITSPYATLANVNDDALIWRVQLQVAF
jgi:phosphate-selective porin OprO/OprP